MRIRAELEQNGKTAVGFAVPEDVVLSLGKGKRPRVRVTIMATPTAARSPRWVAVI